MCRTTTLGRNHSDEVYEQFYAGVPRRRDMGRYETFYANDKAKRLVGFTPRHSWRNEPA